MCIQVLDLQNSFILEMYISCLKRDIQSKVMSDRSEDIHEAFELSLLVESQKLGSKGGFYKPFLPKTSKSTTFTPFTLSNPNTMTTKPNTLITIEKVSTNRFPVIKRLSPTERKD